MHESPTGINTRLLTLANLTVAQLETNALCREMHVAVIREHVEKRVTNEVLVARFS